jgi:hypothetical protein
VLEAYAGAAKVDLVAGAKFFATVAGGDAPSSPDHSLFGNSTVTACG